MLKDSQQTISSTHQDPGRQSFLVRTWTEGKDDKMRISVQNVQTGERRIFYTIKDYINYLRNK